MSRFLRYLTTTNGESMSGIYSVLLILDKVATVHGFSCTIYVMYSKQQTLLHAVLIRAFPKIDNACLCVCVCSLFVCFIQEYKLQASSIFTYHILLGWHKLLIRSDRICLFPAIYILCFSLSPSIIHCYFLNQRNITLTISHSMSCLQLLCK